MPVYYRLPDPAITSISVDGYEHKVNPSSGLLEIEMMTPNLVHDLEVVRSAVRVDPDAEKARAQAQQGGAQGGPGQAASGTWTTEKPAPDTGSQRGARGKEKEAGN